MNKKILKFFDKLEDKIRNKLSHYPVIYSIIGGTAIVVFWRGVWEICDHFSFLHGFSGGMISLFISGIVLLATGLFVSFFIGDTILLSGLKKEKKFIEKTEEEIKTEADNKLRVKEHLEIIERMIAELQNKVQQIIDERKQ